MGIKKVGGWIWNLMMFILAVLMVGLGVTVYFMTQRLVHLLYHGPVGIADHAMEFGNQVIEAGVNYLRVTNNTSSSS